LPTVIVCALLAIGSGIYTANNFRINTDINTLISPDLDWRKRDIAFEKSFDQERLVLVVVESSTPEFAGAAADALAKKLSENKTDFDSVQQLGGGPFFDRNGLLFLPTDQVAETTKQFAAGAPLVEIMAGDPSIRGLTAALETTLQGIKRGEFKPEATERPFTQIAQTIEDVMKTGKGTFSFRELTSDTPLTESDRRSLISVRPKLDFGALEPGKAATDAIRKAASDIDILGHYDARIRLTGPVSIANEEFATVQDGAVLNGVITVLIVLAILWAALHSMKIIFAVFVTLMVGLVTTTAAGLAIVGSFNLISIAFAVLFVGLGVDFGIQFSVRYRSERHKSGDLQYALSRAAKRSAVPLSLAAVATAAGFLSFLPTDYEGVSELGKIAGVGMLIAFFGSITLLPALLDLLNPPGEKEPLGWAFLAPVDEFLETHRVAVIVGTLVVTIAGLPLLYFLHFDFNPMNLRDPKTESVATYLDLRRDPATGTSAINVLAKNQADAKQIEDKLAKVPEVGSTMSLDTFIPSDQPKKLQLIADGKKALDAALNPDKVDDAPTDAENVEALTGTIQSVRNVAKATTGTAQLAANRLAAALDALAKSNQAMREKVQSTFVAPLQLTFESLRALLQAEPVTVENLPQDLLDIWRTKDGQIRVQAVPKGDPNDNDVLRKFADAVLKAEPLAVGGPVSILRSGDTIVTAFIHAGFWALLSISLLLWVVLRKFTDVLLTIVPLLVAGAVTLEVCVLIGLPLNFANIIALPLLLGVGVAFKIYYVTAWRAGHKNLLQSSLTRAIFYSALTTATAFGSLWLSSHPGTASMGKLLALSFVATLGAVLLFQPALMGKPREVGK
jgi:hopanoid biosynthesis associated RND transporter like protein HpnN